MSSETGISEARMLASRANGAKSRGPVTAEGKAKSSRNAVRHSLLAKSLVLDVESEERFHWILQSLIKCFQPANAAELYLVEDLAGYRWRMLRTATTGTADLNERIRQAAQPGMTPAAAAHVLRDSAKSGDFPDYYRRYETSFQRMYLRTEKELLYLQSRRSELRSAASELAPTWSAAPGAFLTFEDPTFETTPAPSPSAHDEAPPPAPTPTTSPERQPGGTNNHEAPSLKRDQNVIPLPKPSTRAGRYIEPRRQRWLDRATKLYRGPEDPNS